MINKEFPMKVKAKESPSIQRVRRKIKQQMSTENRKINETALKKMKILIQKWIERHSHERIPLREKFFTLFDENQNSAKIQNQFVIHLFHKLKQKKPSQKAPRHLEGRISFK
jgi:hypothetical protein